MTSIFPPFIQSCPEPDSPFAMKAHIVPSEHVMTMFYEIDDELSVPEHRHGAQWGVVLAGSMEMTIGGTTRTFKVGDTYYVPEDVAHIAVIHAGYKGIDVFADPHRYQPIHVPEPPDVD